MEEVFLCVEYMDDLFLVWNVLFCEWCNCLFIIMVMYCMFLWYEVLDVI